MTEPTMSEKPGDPPPVAPRPGADRTPLSLTAAVLAAAAATLLIGGVAFAFATVDARNLGETERFQLLGQAANPFIAFLGLASMAVTRWAVSPGSVAQAAPRAASRVAVAVCVAVVLLAVNGILTDLTGAAGGMFKLSAVISRLGTIALGGFGLWIAGAAKPPPVRRPSGSDS